MAKLPEESSARGRYWILLPLAVVAFVALAFLVRSLSGPKIAQAPSNEVSPSPSPWAAPRPSPRPSLMAEPTAAHDLLFSNDPAMGCINPATMCRRIGLALWFRVKPTSVAATIQGQRVTLTPVPDERGDYVEGFFENVHEPPLNVGERVPIEVEAHFQDGTKVLMTLEVELGVGWG